MMLWGKIKQRLEIVTTNDRLDSIQATLQDNIAELACLRKKVRKAPRTYGQIERQRSEYRHSQRHH